MKITEIEKLLIELMKITSVTGNESDIIDFIVAQLKDISIERQSVSTGRSNVIARKGVSKKWLVCHVDTVPGNIDVKITDDKLFGRGACDNKQSVAATILLLRDLPDINALFTVGEEVGFDGARTAALSGVCDGADLVIVQEPTKFEVITGQCGAISFKVKTIGTQQHSSLPNMDNAIHSLVDTINVLKAKKWNAFNVGLISGGVAENVVPGSAEAIVSVRPRNAIERKEILETLQAINTVSIDKDIEPFSSNLDFPERVATHFSEMAFFKNSIQFGAGDIANAHTKDEYILRSELNILPSKLKNLLMNK